MCVLANAVHIEEANANGVPYIDVEGLKAFNKDKTKIKKPNKSIKTQQLKTSIKSAYYKPLLKSKVKSIVI